MPKPLRPNDVPRRGPLQLAEIAGGRLLIRGARGVTVLRDVARSDLERVLESVDGVRSVGEIVKRWSDDYDEAALLDLLAGLVRLGGFEVEAAAPEVHRSSKVDLTGVRILGGGDLASGLVELLGARGDPDSSGMDPETRIRGQELVVLALEDASYGELLKLQEIALRLGVPSLGVTVDPDGVRIGPATLPGAGPCLACAQIVNFRALKLSGRELVQAIADFQTGTVPPSRLQAVTRSVVREVRALSTPGGESELLASVRRVSASGVSTYAVTPAADCPLCGPQGVTSASGARSAVVHQELVDRHRRSPRVASAEPRDAVASVGIVGGGTAGYLTAMALRRKIPGLAVTLIEASDVPVIGVGEATTPLMPQFLHVDLGLDVHELFREVEPTLKLGIRFAWGANDFNYPFGPVHVLEPMVYDGGLSRCSPRSLQMDAGVVPSDLGVDVAYHLDNQRFVRYLQRKARDFGVQTIDARIVDVEVGRGEEFEGASDFAVEGAAVEGASDFALGDFSPWVKGLRTADDRRLSFDFYVDCSGFRSLLLEQALESPFRSYAKSLRTDRALIARQPYALSGDGPEIRPYTLAETLSAGWCWSTPQRDADHRGYVFCSDYLNPEDAEAEMRRLCPDMGDPRLISFRAGRHEHFWHGNVVAMGNAYGFVEPLESTALHMLIRQIGLFVQAFPIRRGEHGVAAVLNRRVGGYWDYLCWFLALHYRFNRRLDTPFWRHCRQETDISAHGELIELFQERGPLSYQGSQIVDSGAPDPLWGAEGIDVLLLGQGVPSRLPRPAVPKAEWQQRARLYQRVAEEAMPQARALRILDQQPELLERWVAELDRVGPAFL